MGFKIAQQSQRLEHVGREVLAFLDHHQGLFALGMHLQQVVIERIDALFGKRQTANFRQIDAQLVADTRQQVADFELAIQHISDANMRRHGLEQGTRQGGLTSADLAGEQDKPTLAVETIL